MIAMPAVDIVQPDLCYVGGLTRALRVAAMAAAAKSGYYGATRSRPTLSGGESPPHHQP